jgi:AbiV family abortive infection protein
MQDQYLKLYRSARNNAVDLVEEAQILFDKGKFARAFFLAFTALEEISKSQLAADVFTGFISEAEFGKYYLKHEKKIERMVWATDEAQHYLDAWEDSYMELKPPTISARMNALYVSLREKNVQSPQDIVSENDARGVIRTVAAALDAIVRNEAMGYQPGTKGFM